MHGDYGINDNKLGDSLEYWSGRGPCLVCFLEGADVFAESRGVWCEAVITFFGIDEFGNGGEIAFSIGEHRRKFVEVFHGEGLGWDFYEFTVDGFLVFPITDERLSVGTSPEIVFENGHFR